MLREARRKTLHTKCCTRALSGLPPTLRIIVSFKRNHSFHTSTRPPQRAGSQMGPGAIWTKLTWLSYLLVVPDRLALAHRNKKSVLQPDVSHITQNGRVQTHIESSKTNRMSRQILFIKNICPWRSGKSLLHT